jgi:hypothetical protein
MVFSAEIDPRGVSHIWGFASQSSVSRLKERLEIVERELQSVTLEWENVFRKLRKIMGKIHREEAIMKADTAPSEEPAGDGAEKTPNGRLLTPHQMQVQQEILRRRARG